MTSVAMTISSDRPETHADQHGHRPAADGIGPEIEADHVTEPVAVLVQQRLIEAVGVAALLEQAGDAGVEPQLRDARVAREA